MSVARDYILDEEMSVFKKREMHLDPLNMLQNHYMTHLKIVILMISFYAMAAQYSLICCNGSGGVTGGDAMQGRPSWTLARQFQVQLETHFLGSDYGNETWPELHHSYSNHSVQSEAVRAWHILQEKRKLQYDTQNKTLLLEYEDPMQWIASFFLWVDTA